MGSVNLLNKRLVASQESNREGRTGSQERRNETGGNALGGAGIRKGTQISTDSHGKAGGRHALRLEIY